LTVLSRGNHQWRISFPARSPYLGTFVHKESGHFEVAISSRPKERSRAPFAVQLRDIGCHVQISPSGAQDLGDLQLRILRGGDKGRIAKCAAAIDVDPSIEERQDLLQIAFFYSLDYQIRGILLILAET
jgi:hypothetical protein